jgi:hypothetical protein
MAIEEVILTGMCRFTGTFIFPKNLRLLREAYVFTEGFERV